MEKPELIKRIKNKLGGYAVNLEIDGTTISEHIDTALLKALNYIDYRRIVTLQLNGKTADVSHLNIDTLVNVYETSPQLSMDKYELFVRPAIRTGDIIDYMAFTNYRSNFTSVISRDCKLIGNTLYVDNYYGAVTIEYIPKSVTIEDIDDGEWIVWIMNYATALCKESIGRVRSKFSVTGSPFELDGSTLIEEAKEDIEKLEEFLNNKPVFAIG